MTIAVYCCITDKYDRLPEVSIKEPGVDYICFTDSVKFYSAQNKLGIWNLQKIEYTGRSADCNRAVKILAHRFLGDKYSYTVYIDAYIDIVGSVRSVINKNPNINIATYRHPFRETLAEEMLTCALSGHSTIWRALSQYNITLDSGYIENFNLQECSVLFRKHGQIDVVAFSKVWWNQYINGIKRDQLSFGLAQQITGCYGLCLGESDPRFGNKIFRHRLLHAPRLRIVQRIRSLLNKLLLLLNRNKYFFGNKSLNTVEITGGQIRVALK